MSDFANALLILFFEHFNKLCGSEFVVYTLYWFSLAVISLRPNIWISLWKLLGELSLKMCVFVFSFSLPPELDILSYSWTPSPLVSMTSNRFKVAISIYVFPFVLSSFKILCLSTFVFCLQKSCATQSALLTQKKWRLCLQSGWRMVCSWPP